MLYRSKEINHIVYYYCVTGQMLREPDELMPEFYAPLENWTVSQGRDVYFTCTVNNLGKYKVNKVD